MKSEIYIVLSDQCNFSCSHCLNCSGPKANRYSLSEKEISGLVQLVNEDSEIECVHFSGGEPTLRLDLIEKFQKAILSDVKYALTTNAWFGKFPEKVFGRIKVDELVVSFDKYHAPFVTRDVVKNAIAFAVRNNIKTTFNSVYESLADLADLEDFNSLGCEIKPSLLIQSGRQADVRDDDGIVDKSIFDGTCPSLDQEILAREKVIYIPDRGFTPCCGPIAFDESGSNEQTFSPIDEDFRKNKLRKELIARSFREQYESLGLEANDGAFHDRCAACVNLYGKHQSGKIPSKFELLTLNAYPQSIKIDSLLDLRDATQLSKSLSISYIYAGEMKPIESSKGDLDSRLVVRAIDDQSLDDFRSLYREIYLKPFSNFISNREGDLQLIQGEEYLKICHLKSLYYKESQPVGILMLSRYNPHPDLKTETLHIGFLGYDRNLLSKEDREEIKSHWLSQIREGLPNSQMISSTIKWFNLASLRFHEELGLTPRIMKVEKRDR